MTTPTTPSDRWAVPSDRWSEASSGVFTAETASLQSGRTSHIDVSNKEINFPSSCSFNVVLSHLAE